MQQPPVVVAMKSTKDVVGSRSSVNVIPPYLSTTTTTRSRNTTLLSEEQRNLVRHRFEKGVQMSDLVPTFMACERQSNNDNNNKEQYFGTALSRRRAEWHGNEQKQKLRIDNNNRDDGNTYTNTNNDKNSFVPWRTIFTNQSLKREYVKSWKSMFLKDNNKNCYDEHSTTTNHDDVVKDNQNYVTFVLEYVPTGALLEARFSRKINNTITTTTSDDVVVVVTSITTEYKLMESEEDICDWWNIHKKFTSHEQFFPPSLRFHGALPDTLHNNSVNTKMQRQYK